MPEPLLVAKSKVDLCLLPAFANRHGLIAGATGTGKTVTLQRIAEGLSRAGVPVKGFTWYPLTDVVDWRYALRIERNDVDPIGLCDLARAVRPVGRAYAALIAGAYT